MTPDSRNPNASSPDFSDVRSGASSTAPMAPQVEQPRTVTVQAGDSLSKIAKREYGDANKWHAIYDANRDKIKNPDLIHPGQVFTLPPDESTSSSASASNAASTSASPTSANRSGPSSSNTNA